MGALRSRALLVLACLVGTAGPAVGQSIRYVDDDASTNGDGVTWNTAYKYLQDALFEAAGDPGVTEVRVAGGTYTPDQDEGGNVTPGDHLATFHLLDGVALAGGHAGLADPGHPDGHDPDAYESTLSGDLLGDDGPDYSNIAENSYHVVTSSGTGPTAVLNGFTITAGNADGLLNKDHDGGGIYNGAGSPTVTDCVFTKNTNYVHGRGAGMYSAGGAPILSHCLFIENRGGEGAAGIHTAGGSPTLTDCTFIDNATVHGGGVYASGGTPTLINCVFVGNRASCCGGGMRCGYASPTLINCVFSANQAAWAGAGLRTGAADVTVINCTFSGNSAGDEGGGLYLRFNSTATVTNCVFWNNTAASGPELYLCSTSNPSTLAISYSIVKGGQAAAHVDDGCTLNWGQGNIDADPLFVDAAGPDGEPGTADDDLGLLPGSPCIDAGDNSAVPGGVTTDLDGNPRFVDDPATDDTGIGEPPIVDLGTFEFQGSPATVVGAISVLNHDGTELSLDLAANNIEPRADGVLKIEFQVSNEVLSASASVSCVNNTYSGSVTTTPADATVTVEFDPALPDRDCCEITLTGDVQDSFSVRTLKGDVNRDGSTNTTDASQIKPRFGQDAATAGPQYDYNTSGTVNTTDFSQIKLFFGNAAPECP